MTVVRTVQSIARYTVYPFVIGVAGVIAYAGIARGIPIVFTVSASTIVAGGLVLVAEWVIPYSRDWLRSHGDLRTDLCHMLITNPLFQGSLALVSAGVATGGVWLSARLGVSLWPNHWPLVVQVPLALVVSELGTYWAHRTMHRTALWRLHAVHHSARRLYWMNSFRLHPLDHLIAGVLSLFPLVLLGADERVLTMFAAIVAAHGFLQHANLDIRLGPLNWIIGAAEVHRWHHSFRTAEMNANYGAMLLVWDIVFGTRFFPKGRTVPPEDVQGLPEIPNYPEGYLGQLASPFDGRLWRKPR